MTGVEILATEEVAIAFEFSFLAFILSWFFITIIGTLFGWLCDTANKKSGWFIGFIISLIIGFVMGLVFGTIPTKPTAYETQYKVTVSDEVPMNQFLERYEIIDQEGKVYTIRERTDYIESPTEEALGYWTGWENASCSECDQFNVLVYAGNYLKYCPYCGIKMAPKESKQDGE